MSEKKSDSSPFVAEAPDGAPLAGKYQLLARLGQGGMSDVYLASMRGPLGFNKLLVLKRLRNLQDDGQALEMFLDEARLAARLKHPNIVDTYDVGQEVDSYFIAMEYLEGQPLSRILKATRTMDVHPTVWVHIIAEALHGLHHAHELCDYDGSPLELVHRDISPHNIFVTYEAEVKVVDFGIAKTKLSVSRTEAGFLKGKIGYMSPEQGLREGIDRRSDIFAMGVVLWEALAGRRPFEGDVATILAKLAHVDIPKLAELRPDLDPRLIRIVERALKRYPNDRFATAAEMRTALLNYLSTVPVAATKADVARTMTTLFAEHRVAVQREIEKQLASAAQQDPAGGNFWDSSRINISYDHQSVPAPGTITAPQRTATASAVSPVSLNQAFSATPVRAPTDSKASTSQRTIMTVLAAIALLAGGGSVLVLRYMRPSTGPASTAVAEIAKVPAMVPENPAAASTPIAPVPPAPSSRLSPPASPRPGIAATPAVTAPSGRSTSGTSRRESPSEIVRSFPNEAPARGSSSRHSAPVSKGRATSSLESPAPAGAQSPSPAPALAAATVAATVTAAPPPPGSVDSKAVAATIKAHGGEVQECFERARMNRPDLQGRLTVQSTIGPDGRVLSTSMTSNIEGGARLESCVQSAWQGWTFPAPAGGVNGTVRKTFNFE